MSEPSLAYNGTAPDGGDSCTSLDISRLTCSDFQSQSLVHHWGHGLDPRLNSLGLAHDSRCRILLLGSCSKKVRTVAHLVIPDVGGNRIIPGNPSIGNLLIG